LASLKRIEKPRHTETAGDVSAALCNVCVEEEIEWSRRTDGFFRETEMGTRVE
jgi:hypothetical protein